MKAVQTILTQSVRLPLRRRLVEHDSLRAARPVVMPRARAAPRGPLPAPLGGTPRPPRPVRRAPPPPHRDLLAALGLAPLARGPVLRARPGRLHALGAPGAGARPAPRAVGDAQAALHHAVGAVGVRALLAGPIWFHGTRGCGPRLRRSYIRAWANLSGMDAHKKSSCRQFYLTLHSRLLLPRSGFPLGIDSEACPTVPFSLI